MLKGRDGGGRDNHRGAILDQEPERAARPEIRQTKKGNHWHFGMKMHISADAGSGIVRLIRSDNLT